MLGKDTIRVDGIEVKGAALRYLMLNKPRGLVTTARDERNRDTVYACLPVAARSWMAPVGRLDKASEGLLLFTNDTAWAARILSPASHLPKVYHVQIDRLADAATLAALEQGVAVDGDCLRAERARLLRAGEKHSWLEITLHEGKNRHIRRLLESCGIATLRLVRVAVGPLVLGELKKGESRALSDQELAAVNAALESR